MRFAENMPLSKVFFKQEIAPITVKNKGHLLLIEHYQQPFIANHEKIAKLQPAFSKDEIVTAANASFISDGVSALKLILAKKAQH